MALTRHVNASTIGLKRGGGVRPESRSRHIVLLHYKHITRPQGPRYLLPNSTHEPVHLFLFSTISHAHHTEFLQYRSVN